MIHVVIGTSRDWKENDQIIRKSSYQMAATSTEKTASLQDSKFNSWENGQWQSASQWKLHGSNKLLPFHHCFTMCILSTVSVQNFSRMIGASVASFTVGLFTVVAVTSGDVHVSKLCCTNGRQLVISAQLWCTGRARWTEVSGAFNWCQKCEIPSRKKKNKQENMPIRILNDA